MTTWREEFTRLSEIERQSIEQWQENGHASNLVISAKDETNAFLRRYASCNFPPHDTEMIG